MLNTNLPVVMETTNYIKKNLKENKLKTKYQIHLIFLQ